MYKCSLCLNVSKPNQPMKRHIIRHKDKKNLDQISSELPVCDRCEDLLGRGFTCSAIKAEIGGGNEINP